MKFNINDYTGNYAMHCKTAEEAKSFCNYLHKHGRKWNNHDSYENDTQWEIYCQDTVYFFNEGMFGHNNDSDFDNYTILEWSDFMNNTFTKADLRTGDVVLRRDGDIEIVIRLDKFELFLRDDGQYNDLYGINDDLTSTFAINRDIIAVRRPNYDHECTFSAFEYKKGILVYDREQEETEEMTLAEVCKLLGKNIKIIQ